MIKFRGLHSSIRPAAEYVTQVAASYGVPVTITSGFRSIDQQRRLYNQHQLCKRQGRYPGPPPCAWPANRPGDSAHNFGWAFDSTVPARYQEWWNYARRAVGFGVPVRDEIHAELPNWRQYR